MVEPVDYETCTGYVEMKQWRESHENRHATIDEILNKLLNRLPLWATTIFTIAGGVIGSLVTVVIFLLSR